ncbi:hypothetical protein M3Y95_00021300 [Aphelenchoides besseyi]|nr:hypothetical protein M3Y95_00021300 [Aphelenchoides besseyi]
MRLMFKWYLRLLIFISLIRTLNAELNFFPYMSNKHAHHQDLTITIKTTKANHNTRLASILDTWFNDAPSNIFVVTDRTNDEQLIRLLGDRLITTNCGDKHDHFSLNCKLQTELEIMAKHNADWSCHFDDDNFVNVRRLRNVLAQYDTRIPFYIGRSSTNRPVEVDDRRFWFATGGAGICLSRTLLDRIRPFIPRFNKLFTNFEAPDDVTFGYLVTNLLKVPLTTNKAFHSHLEDGKQISTVQQQVSLSPVLGQDIPSMFSATANHHLFYSLYCHIHPSKCKKMAIKMQRRLVSLSSPGL